jgi:FtsP/CotA-like multicopper oxidase with cupredoxin domain
MFNSQGFSMRNVSRFLKLLCMTGVFAVCLPAFAQLPICPPRPVSGTLIQNPPDLYSEGGVLSVDLTLQNQQGSDGYMHYCYVYMNQGQQMEAPTLRLFPGDQLIVNLTNNIQAPYDRFPPKLQFKEKMRHRTPMVMGSPHKPGTPDDPCEGGEVLPSSTNIHFHGLNVPPVCHQDDVINTLIQSGDPTFQYSLQIPPNDNPGMYWYHPHPHGYTFNQVAGGASGAIIVEGSNPLTDGLTEHVIVLRQEFPALGVSDPDEGTSILTVNFQPAISNLGLPYINAQVGHQEFYRVVNAGTSVILNLQMQFAGVPQNLQVISLDGVPFTSPVNYTTINLPPAGRVEFIAPPLPANTRGTFLTTGFNSGPFGDPDPTAPLFQLRPTQNAPVTNLVKHNSTSTPIGTKRFANLKFLSPTAQRNLYFSEESISSNAPISLFITVVGQRPHVFHMDDPPAITTNVGAVEDWTIENRSGEAHVFHMHQIHFLVMAVNGVPVTNPELQDTVTVPNWPGSGAYPSVTVRMDFRDPNIAGTFVYHCHILDHEDGGMMAKIQVNPAN